MIATLKYRDVLNDAIKLMLFPYSLEGAARIWYEKEHPNSILTWDDLVNKFVNQLFPPSKTTHLKNEIFRFTQRFEETFREAWECFKEMLRACPHHGISQLTQIDTFNNGLNEQDQASLNAVTGGRFNFRRTSLTEFPAQSIRSSDVIALDSPYLLVLITGTSQSRQHVDTSLIHLESRKSPTAELFDVDSGRISIHHYSISAHLLSGTWRLEWIATFSISTISE
nr:reverse transcriptase domain-containing protein [Tanacetum cinerariifolium]